MMKATRKKRELAAYMSDEIYAALDATWKSQKFIDIANTNSQNSRKNQDRQKIHYRGGALSVGTIRKKMEEVVGHEPMEERVYKRCWGLPDGTMPTQSCSERNARLRAYHEEVVLTDDIDQIIPPPQENKQLIEAYGGINKKGRIPGMGSVGRAANVLLRGSSSRASCTPYPSGGYVRSDQYEEEIRKRTEEQEQLKKEHEEIQQQLERERQQAQQERAEMLRRLEQQDNQIAFMKQLVDKVSASWMHFIAPSQPVPATQFPIAPTHFSQPGFQQPPILNNGVHIPEVQRSTDNLNNLMNMFSQNQGCPPNQPPLMPPASHGSFHPYNSFQQLLQQGVLNTTPISAPQPQRSRPVIDIDALLRSETGSRDPSTDDSTQGEGGTSGTDLVNETNGLR